MTGYHPDFELSGEAGRALRGRRPAAGLRPETLESNVPGIYLAGVIVAGSRTNEIFIENGRFHGRQIAAGALKSIVGNAVLRFLRSEHPVN
jgi:thioredoxin reductase (NADPH)